MKNPSTCRERRLQILTDDLAELEWHPTQQRIQAAIEDAKRRVAKLGPGRADVLKPYQVESATRQRTHFIAS